MSHFITDLCIGCSACKNLCPAQAIVGEKAEKHFIDPEKCIDCGACGHICVQEAIQDSQGNKVKFERKAKWLIPEVNIKKCSSCENCVNLCPAHAWTMVIHDYGTEKNYPELDRSKCISCGWCAEQCQFYAIKMIEAK